MFIFAIKKSFIPQREAIATASFTLDIYGHVTDQMKQASANRMNSFIKDVLNL